MEIEIWKDIPGYNGDYQVSNLGRVKSFKYKKERIMCIKINKYRSGYRSVTLYKKNVQKTIKLHRLVMLAFKGPSKLQVNHIDGVKANNRLDNLEYCTAKENVEHAKLLGLHDISGEKNPNSKLSDKDVLDIKKRLCLRHSYKSIADSYNVGPKCIGKIARREIHV